MWATAHSRGPWSLGQHLARQLAHILPTDPSNGFESLGQVASDHFPGRVEVQSTEKALDAAQAICPKRAIWSDGSRLEDGKVGAGIAWQDSGGIWKTRGFSLGRGQEVLDAELLGVTGMCGAPTAGSGVGGPKGTDICVRCPARNIVGPTHGALAQQSRIEPII